MPPIPQENIFGVDIPAAHSIGDLIDGQLSSTPGQYQFPSDIPKYYTTMAFETYKFRTGTGGTPPDIGLTTDISSLQDFFNTIGEVGSVVTEKIKEQAQQLNSLLEAAKEQLNSTPTPTGSIILPLPVNLVDVHRVKYDEKPILPWLSVLGQVLGAGTDVFKIAGGLVGLAPNYYHTILFDRPEYKRHELTFKLAPTNYDEALRIRNIIMFINNRMSPDITGPGGTAALFTFPDIVRVTLRPNAGFLFKFKPCVVEGISINYAGSGGKKAFYRDPPGVGANGSNPPESVEFTMHLLEVEYWLRDQFTTSNE